MVKILDKLKNIKIEFIVNRLDFNFFCVYFDSALNFQWFLRVDPILVLFCENVILKSILNEQNQNFSTKWSLKKIRHVFNEETKKIKSNSGKLRLLPIHQSLSLQQKYRIFFHGFYN